jgi:hypothetical protein
MQAQKVILELSHLLFEPRPVRATFREVGGMFQQLVVLTLEIRDLTPQALVLVVDVFHGPALAERPSREA